MQKKKDVKEKKTPKKKRRIKTHPHTPPDQLRNYETAMPYGSIKMTGQNLELVGSC